MGDRTDLTPRQRDMANARQRIKYKHTRYHMDHESEATQSLRRLINEIISNEMSPEERALLMRDLEEEMNRIRDYHDAVEFPDEEEA